VEGFELSAFQICFELSRVAAAHYSQARRRVWTTQLDHLRLQL
jgi:hypothetical protein